MTRLLATLVAVASLAACETRPFCLDHCNDDGGPAPLDLATVDATDGGGGADAGDLLPPPDLTMRGDGGPDMMCTSAQLQTDPHNCGTCGHECSYPNAAGLCKNGSCALGPCMPGWVDLDKIAADGCEYQCTPTNVKQCNNKDNFCDGKVNEGFDLTSDPANCGACGVACTYPNATAVCASSVCKLKSCAAGYKDLDGSVANGCEYKCPVWPPQAETCNGVDDDCDGIIDDNPTDVGKACDSSCPTPNPCTQTHSCAYTQSPCNGTCCGQCTPGTTICAGGQLGCQAGVGPSIEVCNGVDDNCDGQIDEGFDLQNDPANCGSCGHVCNAANAVSGCKGGQCVILACQPGFGDVDKSYANGCEYTCPVNPPTQESCNGLDDDCDGIVDDHLTPPSNFCNEMSICNGATPSCKGTDGWKCDYASVNPHIELDSNGNLQLVEHVCDGWDGNCNGMIDESFVNKGKPCSVGNGICQGVATFVCSSDGSTTVCPAQANPMAATDELCNGLDDDCDGNVDERNPSGSPTCYNGGSHPCKGWIDPMIQVGSIYVGKYEASHPDATAVAVGTSTARECTRAGVRPWAPATQVAAAAACAAVKDSTGASMRLCTDAEWVAACTAGSSANPVWAYATSAATYQAGVCNDVNEGAGAPWATGSGAQCYATLGSGIFDMSGNVDEWTGTKVTSNNNTYYQVRGGAFDSLGAATACTFSFTIDLPGYQSSDLGFRCCSDHAP